MNTKVHKEYIYNRPDENSTSGFTSEKVDPERWGWGVIYKDNTELHQFDDSGTFHQFDEIDVPNVKMFTMYRLDDMSKRIDMPICEGMQFFHFYRNIRQSHTGFVRIYVFGWKKGEETTYNFILPDDRMIVSSVDNVDLAQFNIF